MYSKTYIEQDLVSNNKTKQSDVHTHTKFTKYMQIHHNMCLTFNILFFHYFKMKSSVNKLAVFKIHKS